MLRICPCRLDRRARRRRRDLVGGEPSHHHQRRRPRADRRLRLAARRRDPAVRRHLDARQGAGRRLAGLCPRQARQGADAAARPGSCSRSPSSPSIARCSRRSSSSRRWAAQGNGARARRRHRASASALLGADRLGDAALQRAAADRQILRLFGARLIAVLAVVLAGKGVAALQEAGMVGVTPLAGLPRSPMLGLYPTLETLLAQARDDRPARARLPLRAPRGPPKPERLARASRLAYAAGRRFSGG